MRAPGPCGLIGFPVSRPVKDKELATLLFYHVPANVLFVGLDDGAKGRESRKRVADAGRPDQG